MKGKQEHSHLVVKSDRDLSLICLPFVSLRKKEYKYVVRQTDSVFTYQCKFSQTLLNFSRLSLATWEHLISYILNIKIYLKKKETYRCMLKK